jgi:hypothetical protein
VFLTEKLDYERAHFPSGRSHRSLGHFPLVRREGRHDFILLTRRDVEVIERACQLSHDLIELLGGDLELAMSLFQPSWQ